MKTTSLVSVVILLAAASAPAHAQIYKWVDEAGKTHYSDTAPAGGNRTGTVADKVSVYTPDPTTIARAAANASVNPALAERVDSLERQLQAERLARQQVELASYSQAEAPQPVYVPYAVPVRHRRPDVFRPFPAPKVVNAGGPSFVPGTFGGSRAVTAGNVVGQGIMPGTFNGPNAITAGNFTVR
jgi:hypothetical protein